MDIRRVRYLVKASRGRRQPIRVCRSVTIYASERKRQLTQCSSHCWLKSHLRLESRGLPWPRPFASHKSRMSLMSGGALMKGKRLTCILNNLHDISSEKSPPASSRALLCDPSTCAVQRKDRCAMMCVHRLCAGLVKEFCACFCKIISSAFWWTFFDQMSCSSLSEAL